MRQQSESTLQAPAASEDSNRPLSSRPSNARRPSRAPCVPHSTRTGFTHIDDVRQNNFALRLSLADVPPLLDATLQLHLADVPSLIDATLQLCPIVAASLQEAHRAPAHQRRRK
ncbi:hypothetical protein AAVH_24750 [Aphelenchoides avenae]|nr:hypothetical protein AAVH_24750 [Aphelenchus avenae]